VIRAVVLLLFSITAIGQTVGPAKGTLVLEGGGPLTGEPLKKFVEFAGGADARIVYVITAASLVRTDTGVIYNPDAPLDSHDGIEYRAFLVRVFGTENLTILHTRDRKVADSPEFTAPIRNATGVWFGAGNAGRLADAYLGTRTEREFRAVLERGGVIGGTSAGSIIQGSYIVRGRPDKPVLMAKGHEQGFGFLKNVAIDPHLITANRDTELVTVVDAHPELLGIGIDEGAAIVVRGDIFEVIGTSRVAVYDNEKHGDGWYLTLNPGARYDMAKRSVIH